MTTPFDNAPFADNPPQPKKLHDIPFHRHTPGPWELSEGNTSIWGKSPFNARVRLADIRKHSTMNGIDSEANARLIAAAPELLAALEKFLEWHDAKPFGEQDVDLMEAAEAAITKATGE